MKKFGESLYNHTFSLLKYVALVFSALLLFSTLIYTCYIEDMGTQIVLTRTDNILLSVLGCCIFLFLLRLVFHWVEGNSSFRSKILLGITLGWYLLGGAILILFSRTAPGADPMTVFRIGEQCAINYFGAIHPTDSYLSYYPHQIGLVAYFELGLRFWNLLPTDLIGFHFFKVLNVLWTCLMIFCQHKTLELLFHNFRINITYLLLTICNLPLLFYTSFVYGEIPSIALFSAGYLCLLRVFEFTSNSTQHRKLLCYTLLSFLCFTGCMMLRKNAMILMIAVMGVTLFEFIHHKRMSLLWALAVYVLITFLTLPTIQTFYEHRADNHLNTGVTAMSYIAMGMQEGSRAEGWYNGFNFITYENAGLDAELANQISRDTIKERLLYFKENPADAVRFYTNKYRSQWCDGTYASLQATVSNLGGRSPFFERLYNGNYDFIFIPFCNIMQLLLYLGTGIFAFHIIKKSNMESTLGKLLQFPLYLGFIGVFGGFLFHTFWEANARYIFPYALLLYPYAAYGLTALDTFLRNLKKAS